MRGQAERLFLCRPPHHRLRRSRLGGARSDAASGHGFCPQWQKPQFAARAHHTVVMRITRASPPKGKPFESSITSQGMPCFFTRHPEPSQRFYTSSRSGVRAARDLPGCCSLSLARGFLRSTPFRVRNDGRMGARPNFAPMGLVRRIVEMLLQAGIPPRVGRNDGE